ncbi:MAG: hypothetical protein IIX84_00285 [Oscillospiraceae bacterium]|nr:hypothetical protein [Oscillospiraceae bacterium]
MFKYETKGYKILAWASVVALFIRALCLLGALCALVLFFIPLGVSATNASHLAITSITVDFIALAFLFFTSFQTKFFRRKTVWSFVGAAAALLLALVVCVVIVAFEDGSFAAIAGEAIAYLLIGAYMIIPGYLSCKDVYELLSRLSAEAKEREKSLSQMVKNAKKH